VPDISGEFDGPSIVAAEAWHCSLPLRFPVRLGPIRYATRDYVVLRLRAADGAAGLAVGYTRETPLLAATLTLCRQLGAGTAGPADVHRDLARRFAPGWPAFIRAASLIDVALWDLLARRRGVPLAELFGSARPVPVMAVAGYFAGQRTESEILAEAARFVDDGYSTLKVMLPGVDAAADRALLERIRAQTPDDVDIAVDLHGMFTSTEDALAHCAGLAELPVRFVEDPIPSLEIRRVREFAARSRSPVASGEDVVGLAAFEELLDGGVAYLRVDATASGGYSIALPAVDAATGAARSVVPHVFPHIHAPLTARASSVAAIEVIPDYVGADPIAELMTERPPIRGGMWWPSERPGLDLPLDLGAVASAATEHWSWRA
jgi:L-alanine-DL-glutamate epimerase-like enolase superfamily enzyme